MQCCRTYMPDDKRFGLAVKLTVELVAKETLSVKSDLRRVGNAFRLMYTFG